MSDIRLFFCAIGVEAIIILLIVWGLIRQERKRIEGYLTDGRAMLREGRTIVIEFRACVARQIDLEYARRQEHPVVPPDSLPDESDLLNMDGAA